MGRSLVQRRTTECLCPGTTVLLHTYDEYVQEVRLTKERYPVGIFTYYSYINIVY